MTPQVGAFGVVRTSGWKAHIIRWTTGSTVNHAFIYVGNGEIIEANPSGADYGDVTKFPDGIWSDMDLKGRGEAIARAAIRLKGTPYSWVDVVCIGLTDLFGWHVPNLIRGRLYTRQHLMCSQLVDVAYRDAGIALFHDGRVPGDCAPSDLLDLIQHDAHLAR